MAKKPTANTTTVKSEGRKTFEIETYKENINLMLATSTCYPDIRKGMMAALESLLHASGNYRGYRFLTLKEVPGGHLPGIRVDANGDPLEYDYRFLDTDPTRVSYF